MKKPAYPVFTAENFEKQCDTLAQTDEDLKRIIDTHGYPPMWSRPNSFETLVHIILEQQVSLASALATLNKLKEKITDISPKAVLLLTDEELRACYFSRQKTVYVRHLAEQLMSGNLQLDRLSQMSDDEIRVALSKLKGIGNWTVDIYLIFVLQRMDIFPAGDLAAVNALKQLKALPKETTREEVLSVAEQWAPRRTIATMLLWHYYLSLRIKKPKA
jgi:DNA-3-methyladenine glycosylase II